MRERGIGASVVAEVLYETRDPFTRRLTVDRGQQHGVMPGQPVLDAEGVLGQVSRVLPLAAEVTLLTDRNQTLSLIKRYAADPTVLAIMGPTSGAVAVAGAAAANDLKVPLNVSFGVFASFCILSVFIVLMIRPRENAG